MNYQTEAEKIYQSVCGGTESSDTDFAKLHRESCTKIILFALEHAHVQGRIEMLEENIRDIKK